MTVQAKRTHLYRQFVQLLLCLDDFFELRRARVFFQFSDQAHEAIRFIAERVDRLRYISDQ